MKKLLSSSILSTLLIMPLISQAKPPITCPSILEYTCVADAQCPVSRCTVTSKIADAWTFLAPSRIINQNEPKPQHASCSNLLPGKYRPMYLASIYGHGEPLGYAAACIYVGFRDYIAISVLFNSDYTTGKGHWQAGESDPTTFVCTPAWECEFDPIQHPENSPIHDKKRIIKTLE